MGAFILVFANYPLRRRATTALRSDTTMVALGGVICHLLLIPPWVFCTVLPCVATAMLLQRAQLAVLVAQVVLSTLAYQKPKTGVPVALVSSAISYAMYLGGDTVGFAGSFIYSAMQWINWGVTFPYVPAFTRLIFGLDMSSYYKKCELRGALDRMGRSRTLYLFHPHGVITVGFSTNGVWSREFNERTTELEVWAQPEH